MAIFPSGVPSNSDLYVALDNFGAALDGAIDASQTSIVLTHTTNLPTVGILTIELEKIKYTGVSGNTLTGVTRGFSATTAAPHASGVGVWFNVVEEHHNVLKDETIAIAQNLSDRIGLSTTQILAPVGSAASPSITFTGDTDTGIYRGGANVLGLAVGTGGDIEGRVNSVSIFTFRSGGIFFTPQILKTANDLATAPDYSFNGDTDTGIYRAAADDMRLAAGGVRALQVTPGAVTIGRHEAITTSLLVYGNQSMRRYSDDTGFDRIQIQKHRGTLASPAAAQSGDVLGMWEHQAYDGFTIRGASQITTTLSGTIGSNQVPSYMSFLVATASGLPGERLRITGPGAQVQISNGSAGTPALSFLSDTDTGIYRVGADTLELVAGTRQCVRVDDTLTAGETRLFVWDVNTASMRRVTVGAADSGGTGFKVLRIAN